MIRMVVFNMAGTTVNEDNLVYKTLQQVINNAGYHFTLHQVLAVGAGKEKLQAIRDILHSGNGIEDEQFAAHLYRIFETTLKNRYDNIDVTPQDGAADLFKMLKQKNIFVILNTGYNSKTAQGLLNKLNWQIGVQIDGLITASDVTANRPMPDMIQLAMKQFGITDAKEVVKVGDSTIDIEEGKNAGCSLSIGITTGAHNWAQLATAKPDYIIQHLMEFIPFLN